MILLGRIESAVRLDSGNDVGLERVRLVELGDVGPRDLHLLGVDGKNRRAVLRAGIRSLPIELGRIMRHREIDLQDVPVADRRGSNVTLTDSACPVLPVPTIS